MEEEPFAYIKLVDLLHNRVEIARSVSHIATVIKKHSPHGSNPHILSLVRLTNKINSLPEHLSAEILTARNELNDVKQEKTTSSDALAE